MLTAGASTVIGAPIGCIWHVLSDLEAFVGWNPCVTRASGVQRCNAVLDLELTGPLSRSGYAIVLEVRRHRSFSWLLMARSPQPGEHPTAEDALVLDLEITATRDGRALVTLRLSASASASVWDGGQTSLTRWLATWLAALKDRVESRQPEIRPRPRTDTTIRVCSRHGARVQLVQHQQPGLLGYMAGVVSRVQRAVAA